MPVDVLTEATIGRSVGEVASYVADPTNAPEWYRNIESVVWRTEPPIRVGSRTKVGAKAMAAAMRRANRKDLDNLRSILAARP